jgi:nitroimidazol reductase NimA-like FMN-containing flavoprotein (pyridoxamine 5'-phosphate oxidase superfamily)
MSQDEPTAADPTMHVLSTEECYRLLATQEVGRIGLNAEDHPLIFPVNYVLDDTTLVIRTAAGTILGAAENAHVAFEVDEIDRRTRSGWSVLVRGRAEDVAPEHRAPLLERAQAAGVEPWAPGEHGHWLRIIPYEVTGRRIVPGQLPFPMDPRAYL